MQELSRHTAQLNDLYPSRVLQFGGGNFLRGFADWMIQILNEETEFGGGVILVKSTSGSTYSKLKAQDGLYHVVLNGLIDGQVKSDIRLISCINQIIHCHSEWDEYIKSAGVESIRFIISNTTEAGIKFIKSDQYDDKPPSSFPAKLTIWLYTRYSIFNGSLDKGCIILPCELIEHNGQALKSSILQYSLLWNLGQDFIDWIDNANTFCDTLVDRIVSGYPRAAANSIRAEIGYNDQQIVSGELYHSWIISNRLELREELPLAEADLNVQFVENIDLYREIKVKVLNGAHTTMVPVGYLSGCRTVLDAMTQAMIASYIEAMLREEVLATIQLPVSQIDDFIDDVLNRFRNPTINHQLISIALNSTSKFITRLLPTIKSFQKKTDEVPQRIVFGLASLIRMYKGEWKNEVIKLNDNPISVKRMTQLWSDYESTELGQFVKAVLSDQEIWGEDLTEISGLVDVATEQLWLIETYGMPDALQHIIHGKSKSTA